MKILFIGPNYENRYNRGHWLFQRHLASQTHTTFLGPGWPGFDADADINAVIVNLQPDVIITWHAKRLQGWFRGLANAPKMTLNHRPIKRVHIIVDYDDRAGRTRGHHALWDLDKYDLLIARTRYEYDLARANRTEKVIYIPYSIDPAVFTDPGHAREWDVACIGSANNEAYPTRREVMAYVRSLPRTLTGFTSGGEYISALQRSKIFVAALGDKRTIPQKWLEACACGALLLTEKADDVEAQGWEHGVNCLFFSDVPDLARKITYTLDPDHADSLARIAAAGRRHVIQWHTNHDRVEQLLSWLRRI